MVQDKKVSSKMRFVRWRRQLTGFLPVNIVQGATAIGSVALYSRLMTTSDYGHYVLAQIGMLWMQLTLSTWLHMGVARFSAPCIRDNTRSRLLSSAYAIFFIISIFCIAIAEGLSLLARSSQYSDLIWPALIAGLSRSLTVIGLETHRNSLNIVRYNVLECLQLILNVLFSYIFLHMESWKALAPLWGLALANIIVFLLDARYLIAHSTPFSVSRQLIAEMWKYGSPAVLAEGLQMVISSSDRFLLAYWMSEEAVAMYSINGSLSERPLAIIFTWIGAASLSLAFNTFEQSGVAEARKIMDGAARSLVLIAWPAFAGLLVIGYPLLFVILGEGFHDQPLYLFQLIAFIGVLKNVTDHYTSHVFQITRHTRRLPVIFFIAAIINVLSNIVLIPKYGLYGTAISACLTHGSVIIIQISLARFIFPIPIPWLDMAKGVFACGIMMVAVFLLHIPNSITGLVVGITVGIFVYACIAIMLNIANVRDWLWVGGTKGHLEKTTL